MTSQQTFPSHWDNIPPPIPYSSRPAGPTAKTTATEETKEPYNPNQSGTPGKARFESHWNNTSHSIHAASAQLSQPKPDHPAANPPPATQQAVGGEQHQQQPKFTSHSDNAPQPTETANKKEGLMEDLVGLMKGASIAEGPAKVEAKKSGHEGSTGFPSHWDLVDSGVLEGPKCPSNPSKISQPQQPESHQHNVFSMLSKKAEGLKETMRETMRETVKDTVHHLASFNPKHVEKQKPCSTTSKFASHWELVDSGVLPPPSVIPLPQPKADTCKTTEPTQPIQPKVDPTASALEAFTNLKISEEPEPMQKQVTEAPGKPPGENKFASHWDTDDSKTAEPSSSSSPPAPTPIHEPKQIHPPSPPAPTESQLFPPFDPSSPPPIPIPSPPSPIPTNHNRSQSAAYSLLWSSSNPNAPKAVPDDKPGLAFDMPQAVPTDPTLEALDWPATGEVLEDNSVRFREDGKQAVGYGGHWAGAFVEEEDGGVKLEKRA